MNSPLSSMPGSQAHSHWRPGDRVIVAGGCLAGLAGTVCGNTAEDDYILDLDGLTHGVRVILGRPLVRGLSADSPSPTPA